jgi:DNA modification methylase
MAAQAQGAGLGVMEWFLNNRVQLHCGDCLDVLAALEENSIDSCVTDPPYHLSEVPTFRGKVGTTRTDADRSARRGFMGKQWDGGDIAFRPEVWREVYRTLKPGAHLLAFGGTRTHHRMVCAIEDAGFEIRDTIMWVYGSGFPKSHDVSKGIDRARKDSADWVAVGKWLRRQREAKGFRQKDVALLWPSITGGLTGCVANWELGLSCPRWEQWLQLKWFISFGSDMDAEVWRLNGRKGTPGEAWNEREKIGEREATLLAVAPGQDNNRSATILDVTAPATPAARQWEGWGTALKPAAESIVLARKPLRFLAIFDIIGSNLVRLESQLWSMLPANSAEKNFGLSRSEFGAACASAQWNAEERNSTRDALCAQMDTSRFVLALTSSLSTVSSWKNTWAEALAPENISTTETELSTIIDLRTLNFLLLKITPNIIMQAHKSGLWSIANASIVVRSFDAAVSRLRTTLELSVLAPAISRAADASLGAGVSPNLEPVVLARKPLSEKTVAENVLRWGCGALNIGRCRVETDGEEIPVFKTEGGQKFEVNCRDQGVARTGNTRSNGRWPANVIHDGSAEVVGAFPETQSPKSYDRNVVGQPHPGHMSREAGIADMRPRVESFGDSGSAARFFYTAKADADDRLGSRHPTIKPLDLMQYLVRLITPPKGTCLDCFAGTGTTGEAAFREGMSAVLIEREAEYQDDIRRRMKLIMSGPDERARESIKQRMKGKPVDNGPLFAEAAE